MMFKTNAVLTLQFGNFTNFIGSHWWNIQESGFNYDDNGPTSDIDNDVFYREGVNLNRQTTYTPRLLLVDLDGALKHLPREGELYGNFKRPTKNENTDDEDVSVKKLKDNINWPDNVELWEKSEIEKNSFQKDLDNPEASIEKTNYNLVENVESWADFLYARYHPRTVNVVNNFKHSVDKQTFDTYSCGVELWKTEQFSDDFCDKIRQYVEECDYLQGFQTVFDCYNGFSGLASKCLEYINDEYTKANFVVPVYSPKNILFENADEPMSDSIRVVNSALAFNALTEQASMFMPISTQDRVWRQLGKSREISLVNYRSENYYQTSAILAACLDTISLRYRLKDAPASNSLAGFCGDLTNYGRKLVAAGFAMPFQMQQDEDLIDCLDRFEGPLFTQLTPNCTIGTDYIIQSMCVRGIPNNRLKRPLAMAKKQMRMAAYKCDSVSEMFQLYLQCSHHASLAHVSSLSAPMPTRVPFPCEIFNESLNNMGFISTATESVPREKIISVPTLATVQCSSELGNTVDTLHREAKRIKIAKLHRFKMSGLEEEEYVDALENLLLFKDNYDDNFEL
ncbi:protein misato-like [Teleopsis dalmanni]|uniref:protein misato-like n=1 Tax=Teleopsis dalmanni TaxID=139649 RepID=UPI0018CFEA2D|nr:protein misato-like [Teleopsis dalmanni]XP_037936450.1 protein misato-like [Teleopsis dalmanni]